MRKKIVQAAIALVMVLTMALGTGVAVAQEEGTGPITYNSYMGDPVPRRVDTMIVEMWNEAHPEMPVQHSIIAHEDFKQAIRAYLTAEPAPDVMTWFAGNRARFFIDRGLIADISDMWEENGFDDVYAPGFKALATVGDGIYFLPTSYYWWAVYYRPSLFEEAGITEVPETWDDFLAACDTLNEAGITPITIGTRYPWTTGAWFDYLNMRVNGPEFHIDLMLLKESYTDPRVREVFDYWKQLLDHNCFIENAAAYTWQEGVSFMANKEAAMYLMGQFIADEVSANYAEQFATEDGGVDLDFFRFPIINPDVPIGEDAPTDGYFIAANARNLAGGKAFLAFLGSREVQQLAFEEIGRLPTRTDVDISGAGEATQKGIALIQGADYVAQFYDRDTTPEMAELGMSAFVAFWDDPASIDSLLENLEVNRARIAEEMAAQ